MNVRRVAMMAATVLLAGTLAAVGAPQAGATSAVVFTPNSDAGLIGWDGDTYAVEAHLNGGYRVLMTNIGYGFGVATGRAPVQWYAEGGYLPALTSQFEAADTTVRITNFGDKVTEGGHDYVAVYSRVSVFNHGATAQTIDPAPEGAPFALNAVTNTVQPGQTINHDYVVASDKFGGVYDWPSAADLVAAGGYDDHFAHMKSYWDTKLAGITQVRDTPTSPIRTATGPSPTPRPCSAW